MEYFKKVFKESIIIVIISSFMGLLSGTLLSINEKIIYAIPIILLILPSLNSLIGDICTVLTSRLTTHLHIGSIPPKVQKSERLVEDFIGLLITLLVYIIIYKFNLLISKRKGSKQSLNPFCYIISGFLNPSIVDYFYHNIYIETINRKI